MKKILTILVATILTACAADVTLEWDANPPEQLVVEYRLYEQVGTNYTMVATSAGTSATLSGVSYGPHTWVLTAVNSAALESERSLPASTIISAPLTPPQGLRVSVVVTVELP
jgi:hypothetical protein